MREIALLPAIIVLMIGHLSAFAQVRNYNPKRDDNKVNVIVFVGILWFIAAILGTVWYFAGV